MAFGSVSTLTYGQHAESLAAASRCTTTLVDPMHVYHPDSRWKHIHQCCMCKSLSLPPFFFWGGDVAAEKSEMFPTINQS